MNTLGECTYLGLLPIIGNLTFRCRAEIRMQKQFVAGCCLASAIASFVLQSSASCADIGAASVPPTETTLIKALPPVALVGHLVLDEKVDKSIETSYGTVVCAPHSVVYLFQTKNSLAVFVLGEKNNGDVSIRLGDKSIAVRPAREVVVTKL